MVQTLMTPHPIACSPDDDIPKALNLMEVHKIRRIPAVDDSGRIVGIISQADVALRLHNPFETTALVEEISRPRIN